jgi:hypothetical protein
LLDARVSPRRAHFAGRRVQIAFAVDAAAPLALQVDVVREAPRKPVVTLALPAAAPAVGQRVEWDGRRGSGAVAPNGRWRWRVAAPDGTERNAGSIELRATSIGSAADTPTAAPPASSASGAGTRASTSMARAACRSSPPAGRRDARGLRPRLRSGISGRGPVLYGNIVIVHGERTERDYWYSHLLRTPRLRVGERVSTGQEIGSIGATGIAPTIGCHLHFEIRARGRLIDPEAELHARDGWS